MVGWGTHTHFAHATTYEFYWVIRFEISANRMFGDLIYKLINRLWYGSVLSVRDVTQYVNTEKTFITV